MAGFIPDLTTRITVNVHSESIDEAISRMSQFPSIVEALENKKKLEKEKISFTVKTGKEDKVFGSISVKQIKESLNGYDIDKKQIIIDNPITSLGFHNVKINLYKDVVANIKVEVKK